MERSTGGKVISVPADLRVSCSCGAAPSGGGTLQHYGAYLNLLIKQHKEQGHVLTVHDPEGYLAEVTSLPDQRGS